MKLFSVNAVFCGRKHRLTNMPCQDAAYTAQAEHCYVSALSDGAGSRKFSEYGAALTAKSAAAALANKFDSCYAALPSETAKEIVYLARKAIYEKSLELKCEMKELGCTLLLSAVHDDGRVYCLHIGDGLIYGIDKNGRFLLLSSYEHEIAVNVTTLITSFDTQEKEYRFSKNICGTVMLTDGAEQHIPNNPKLLEYLVFLGTFLTHEKFIDEAGGFFEYMTDDSSVAITADTSVMPKLFSNAEDKIISLVLGISPKAVGHRKKYLTDVLTALSKKPCTLQELTRIMHLHKPSLALKKLQPFISRDIIILRKGKFYIKKSLSPF